MNEMSCPKIDLRHFAIRPLTTDDADAYRAIRKRILEVGDGRYHSASYRRDKTFKTEQQMRAWCMETREHCIMGTFYDGELVGIMTGIAHGPKEKRTADWDSVWLDPRFRKLGIAKRAYEKLEEWTKKNGYRHVETFVRADNLRVLEIRRKRGSIHTHTKRNEVWADGSVADAYFFMTNLYLSQAGVHADAIRHLESTLQFLDNDQAAKKEPKRQKMQKAS